MTSPLRFDLEGNAVPFDAAAFRAAEDKRSGEVEKLKAARALQAVNGLVNGGATVIPTTTTTTANAAAASTVTPPTPKWGLLALLVGAVFFLSR